MVAMLSTLHGTLEFRTLPTDSISVSDFMKEVWDDYKSPTTSTFVSRLGQCRSTASGLEETLDYDRSGLTKMKKSVKALYSSGNMHVTNESYFAENLERLGNMQSDNEPDISTAFIKFAIVTKELSALMKNLMQKLNNIVMFPLDSFLKGDLRGIKGDLKKPFDKASKEYDAKFAKIEKEKKQLAREAGLVKTEVSGAEIAEDLEKERRMFQLQLCEYLIKVNEIKTKKGAELLQHLVDYYQAQHNYFQDGLKTIEHFQCYIEELVVQLGRLKQKQDVERRNLVELRDVLRNFMSSYRETPPVTSVYNLHQLQGNKVHGSEKSGYLLKRSEGRMRKVWQRRKCVVHNGLLSIGHSDVTKEPVKLNLLTCQVKLVTDDATKKCFNLVSSSKNRMYHFQAEDTQDMETWISVLNNAKEQVLMKAFGDASNSESSAYNQSVKELTFTILQQIRRLPGNQACCDCGAPDPEWLSVNLGVLICLECCGIHRDMGVHISRTQSLVIDDLGTAQLLLARVVSNRGFNEIMEATLDARNKPVTTSNMDEKKLFIRSKYEQRRYAIVTCADVEDRLQDLKQAILSHDIQALLQVFAEGIDFMQPLPDTDNDETALHLSILHDDDNTSLYMVDFIIQNTNSQELCRRTKDGSTALHLCALHNKPESLKLLLRCRLDLVNLENSSGLTALEIAQNNGHQLCVELLNHAIAGKTEPFEHVNIDWGFVPDEHQHDGVDFSDDELDNNVTPERRSRARPGSLVLLSDPPSGWTHKERSRTTECPKVVSQATTTFKSKTLPNHSGPSQSLPASHAASAASASVKKKAPPPPPPVRSNGHMRNPSDPGLSRTQRSPSSDPPPLPAKTGQARLPGAKFVLPPVVPPKPRTPDNSSTLPLSFTKTDRSWSTTSTLEGGDAAAKRASMTSRPLASRLLTTSSVDTLSSLTAALTGSAVMSSNVRKRQCVALYDCEADNDDELSFREGEVINVISEDEEEWWQGEIASQPSRRGMFPATWVRMINS